MFVLPWCTLISVGDWCSPLRFVFGMQGMPNLTGLLCPGILWHSQRIQCKWETAELGVSDPLSSFSLE